ncbi:MAG: hypothetical protein J0L67_15340 [Cytophagales bacterium]|nr:hypothetical protein [Cytophagales bacterium]
MKVRLLIFLIAVVMLSCTDDSLTRVANYERQIIDFLTLEKNSFDPNGTKIEQLINSINFESIDRVEIQADENLLLFDLSKSLSINDKSILHRIVFFEQDGIIVRSFICTFSSSTDEGKINDVILHLVFPDRNMPAYSGIVSLYDNFQNLINYSNYNQGLIIESGLPRMKAEKEPGDGRKATQCVDWYLVTTYYYSDGTTETVEIYLYTSCDEPCGFAGPGGRIKCGGGGGSGGSEEAGNRLCGVYGFTDTGDGLTGENTGLFVNAVHTSTGEFINIMWGAMCLTFGSGTPTPQIASETFIMAWNLAMDETESWLNLIGRKPSDVAVSNFVLNQLRANLGIYTNGYFSLATGPCLGGIASTRARYCI